MYKKVLITGANGLLGQKLIDLYLQQPNKILIATGIGPCRHERKGEFRYEELDITDEKRVMYLIKEISPDAVIHTAAMTNVDACETDHATCDKLNVDAVKYLVKACNEVWAHLIHISTDFIFDGTHGPLSEKEIPKPISYYGWSKYRGEQEVIEHCKDYTILRTVLVYGVVSDMSRSNIVLWAKGALEKQQPMKVVNDQFRTPTLAEDLAMGCFLSESKFVRGIFNISGKDFLRIDELVHKVADFFGYDKSCVSTTSSDVLNQAAKRPPITGFLIDKARKELGYEPHSFEEGLAIVAEQLKNIK
ncbi:MAG: SDR family oxidoreductase [Chitinophagaceae bacterium]